MNIGQYEIFELTKEEAIMEVIYLRKYVNDHRHNVMDRMVAEKEMVKISEEYNITYGDVWNHGKK